MTSRIASLLLVLLAVASQGTAQPATGSFVGRVVDGGTGNPVAGVSVWLNGPVSAGVPWPPTPGARPSRPPPGTPPLPDPSVMMPILGRLRAETNADGVFEIHDVPNGRWAIQARKDGYVQLTPATMPLVAVVAGRRVSVPDIRLDRGGAVTGRVLDARGNAMTGVQILAFQMRASSNGTMQLTGSGASAPTNDLGEFRLAGLPPGDHYVAAQPRPTIVPLIPEVRGSMPAVSSTTYVATFYPGAVEAALASPIKVFANGTTAAIDFTMQTVPAYQVAGVVVDSGGRPVSGAIVRLAATRATLLGTSFQGGPSAGNGSFRIVNVPAGTYGAMAAVPTIIRNGGAASGSLNFGAAARPGAAPEVTIQGDTANLRIVVSQP